VPRTRIALANANRGLLDMLVERLDRDFDVVAAVGNGDDLLDAVAALMPAVVVLDVSMPGISGLEAAGRLQRGGCSARVVFFTSCRSTECVRAAFGAGASGYVLVQDMETDLRQAIKNALAGDAFVSASLPPRDIV